MQEFTGIDSDDEIIIVRLISKKHDSSFGSDGNTTSIPIHLSKNEHDVHSWKNECFTSLEIVFGCIVKATKHL